VTGAAATEISLHLLTILFNETGRARTVGEASFRMDRYGLTLMGDGGSFVARYGWGEVEGFRLVPPARMPDGTYMWAIELYARKQLYRVFVPSATYGTDWYKAVESYYQYFSSQATVQKTLATSSGLYDKPEQQVERSPSELPGLSVGGSPQPIRAKRKKGFFERLFNR
jgi:hypothetical protein